MVIGNGSVANIGGQVAWSNLSDSRFKKNIEPETHGLDFIMKLKPVTYNLDVHKLNTFLGVPTTDEESAKEKEAIVYSGFLAQDVEQAANDVDYNFSGVVKPQNEKDHYSLVYSDFVIPLVKAVQEQQHTIDSMKIRIDSLENMNKTKEAGISQFKNIQAKNETDNTVLKNKHLKNEEDNTALQIIQKKNEEEIALFKKLIYDKIQTEEK